jgi:hypothetical protein
MVGGITLEPAAFRAVPSVLKENAGGRFLYPEDRSPARTRETGMAQARGPLPRRMEFRSLCRRVLFRFEFQHQGNSRPHNKTGRQSISDDQCVLWTGASVSELFDQLCEFGVGGQ